MSAGQSAGLAGHGWSGPNGLPPGPASVRGRGGVAAFAGSGFLGRAVPRTPFPTASVDGPGRFVFAPRALLGCALALCLGLGAGPAQAGGSAGVALRPYGLKLPEGARIEPLPAARWHGAAVQGAIFFVPLAPDRVLEHVVAHADTALRATVRPDALVLAPADGKGTWLLRLRGDAAGTHGVVSSLRVDGAPDAAQAPSWLPPGARPLLHLRDAAGGVQAIHHYQGWQAQSLAAHLHAALRREGWAAQTAPGMVSQWRHRAAQLLLVVLAATEGSHVVLHLEERP